MLSFSIRKIEKKEGGGEQERKEKKIFAERVATNIVIIRGLVCILSGFYMRVKLHSQAHFWSKKVLSPTNFSCKKILGPKKFGVKQILCQKKCDTLKKPARHPPDTCLDLSLLDLS